MKLFGFSDDDITYNTCGYSSLPMWGSLTAVFASILIGVSGYFIWLYVTAPSKIKKREIRWVHYNQSIYVV
jgi:hypothetical protein